MSDIAKKHKDQLERIKDNIENSYKYFESNYKRFNEYRNFVFVSTLTDNEITLLNTLQKPVIEFNVLEAYISRLRGEFSKNEPSLEVSAKDGKEVDQELITFIDGHLRYILTEANKDGLEYNSYTDTLSGGFSAFKVFTEYTGEMSFHQDIKMRRVFDPTLTGFDPLAERMDKTDGEFCYEIYPQRKTDFEKDHPDINLSGIKYIRNVSSGADGHMGSFSWSYKTNRDDMLLVADYYEKKKVNKTIVMLADGQVMTKEDYNSFLEEWEKSGIIAQAPAIVGKPRKTQLTKIVRYKVIENQVFDYEETDYRRLPITFVDGNSILTREGGTGPSVQMTRPYIYQAMGAQKLKNFCGQTLANEIENMGPGKMIASLDSIPPQYIDAYNKPQEAHMYIYNAFKNGDPNVPLAPPQPIPRPQIPGEIAATFMGADAIVQNVLGSFDATMTKITDQQVSGIAIQESATLSNASAMPYVVSFMKGLQSAAQTVVELIPLYYKTPRTVPVIDSMGNKSYVKINQEGGISIDYDHDAIQVNVEAGVSFNLQQTRALQQIIALMGASPLFAQFINDEGLDIVLDNVEIRNIEELRKRSQDWMQKQKQMQAIAQQEAMSKPNTEQQALQIAAQQVQSETQLGQAKVQMQAASEQAKTQVKAEELRLEADRIRTERMKALAEIMIKRTKNNIEQQKVDNKVAETAVDATLKARKQDMENQEKMFDKAIQTLEDIATQEDVETEADIAMVDIVTGE